MIPARISQNPESSRFIFLEPAIYVFSYKEMSKRKTFYMYIVVMLNFMSLLFLPFHPLFPSLFCLFFPLLFLNAQEIVVCFLTHSFLIRRRTAFGGSSRKVAAVPRPIIPRALYDEDVPGIIEIFNI